MAYICYSEYVPWYRTTKTVVTKCFESQGPVSIYHKTSLFKVSKSKSHAIGIKNGLIAMKFDRHFGSSAANVSVQF